jgi:hypothetical protein
MIAFSPILLEQNLGGAHVRDMILDKNILLQSDRKLGSSL